MPKNTVSATPQKLRCGSSAWEGQIGLNHGGVEVVTREANASDLDRAAEVLGDAFTNYPWTRWTVDASRHQQQITTLQRIALEHFALPFGGVSVTTVAGEIASVVAWSDSAALSLGNVDAAVPAQVAELEGSRHAASNDALKARSAACFSPGSSAQSSQIGLCPRRQRPSSITPPTQGSMSR